MKSIRVKCPAMRPCRPLRVSISRRLTRSTNEKAQFQDFEPFWEFVSGPLHAGTFGPNALENTFGPEVGFIKAPGLDKQNLPPSAGMRFFGHVKIDGVTGQMIVTLRDRADVALWSITLDPKTG